MAGESAPRPSPSVPMDVTSVCTAQTAATSHLGLTCGSLSVSFLHSLPRKQLWELGVPIPVSPRVTASARQADWGGCGVHC